MTTLEGPLPSQLTLKWMASPNDGVSSQPSSQQQSSVGRSHTSNSDPYSQRNPFQPIKAELSVKADPMPSDVSAYFGYNNSSISASSSSSPSVSALLSELSGTFPVSGSKDPSVRLFDLSAAPYSMTGSEYRESIRDDDDGAIERDEEQSQHMKTKQQQFQNNNRKR